MAIGCHRLSIVSNGLLAPFGSDFSTWTLIRQSDVRNSLSQQNTNFVLKAYHLVDFRRISCFVRSFRLIIFKGLIGYHFWLWTLFERNINQTLYHIIVLIVCTSSSTALWWTVYRKTQSKRSLCYSNGVLSSLVNCFVLSLLSVNEKPIESCNYCHKLNWEPILEPMLESGLNCYYSQTMTYGYKNLLSLEFPTNNWYYK